jgi:ABC-2 type transport system ATP-binding protein
MRLHSRIVAGCAALALASTTAAALTYSDPAAGSTTGHQRAEGRSFSKKTMHLQVHIGPGRSQRCSVVFDLYRPRDVNKHHRAPAVLTTNGFGGSKDSQATVAKQLVQHGYVVLAYSGVGFGGSSCRIELDSFSWDGLAAKQLVTFLGGGSKATNGSKIDYVKHNKRAHNGHRYRHDPVVGMIGGSYGGGAQFAAAAEDPRIDAVIPEITWNDLDYSLAPNNAGLTGESVQSSVPGIVKANPTLVAGVGNGWLNLLWYSGTTSTRTPPLPASGCPNFDVSMCAIHTQLVTDGYPDSAARKKFRTVSISSRMNRVRIPVLLQQGENDSLFNLQQAVATYHALKKQHVPVKLVWQSPGHSGPTETAGEAKVLSRLDGAWFRYYLKHRGPKPAHDFTFFRPWVTNTGHAFASAPSYPIATTEKLYLSNTASSTMNVKTLTPTSGDVSTGSVGLTTPGNGDPESLTQQVNLVGALQGMNNVTVSDPDGTSVAYESAPLTQRLDVVGVPKVTVTIASTGDLSAAPAGTLGLFFRVEDVAPDGTVTLPDGLISAARFATSHAGSTVTVQLPGIAHRFAKGDRIRLVVAGSDSAYFLPNPDTSVTVSTDASSPGVLDLPVAGPDSYHPIR